MRAVKTRETVKSIKVLDKHVDLSKRMNGSYIRTKECAGETRQSQDTHSASPTGYAINTVTEKTEGAAGAAASRLPNPRMKAMENIQRAKSHFEEVRRLLPQERRHAAEQAQKAAHKAKDNADRLRKTANEAWKTANDAKKAVGDAKQTLKQVRLEGRQTLREVRQKAKLERNGKLPETPKTASTKANAAASPKTPNAPINDAPGGVSQPNYLSGGITKNASNAAKSADKTAKAMKSTTKGFKQTAKGTVKTAKKSVKTAEKSAKAAVKTAKHAAKAAHKTAVAAAKAAKAAQRAARLAAKAAVKSTKVAVKAVIAAVKITVAAIKGLIALIAAGGWIAVLIILVICMVAMLVGSIFGIFFSSAPDLGTGQTVNGVVSEINNDYTAMISAIIGANPHDLLDMSGARATWKQVLAVYTVRTVADPDSPMEVATMNDEKAAILRAVFWDMHTITHALDTVEIEEDVLDDDDVPTGETETVAKTVLRITVSYKTADEMAVQYGFTNQQREWLAELLKPEYHSLWNALLYGVASVGSGSMLEVADTQLGNVGGEIYWRWYGLSNRVEWCAIFVSWVAGQCGYIDEGVIPKFASVAVGIQWFKNRDQWQDAGYTPAPGDLIFFDWEPDGKADHVGIVESVADGRVNTIEGNSNDSVRRRSYDLGSIRIVGYGIPEYND